MCRLWSGDILSTDLDGDRVAQVANLLAKDTSAAVSDKAVSDRADW